MTPVCERDHGAGEGAFKYRFCPTNEQAAELSRTVGCVRKVRNLAPAARTQAWARQEGRLAHGREVITVDRLFPPPSGAPPAAPSPR
ncbi:hypothetical protein GCM10022384_13000 [Streptomyces marokkonensis]|uniref:Transposase putative helix-turn-helix domain-containing protein n=1 Tax=Streptomyces marokkonensis TaxID=324855 RepID=A0ABP7PAW6_9ACTN